MAKGPKPLRVTRLSSLRSHVSPPDSRCDSSAAMVLNAQHVLYRP